MAINRPDTTAAIAREKSRTAVGQFGEQEHTAPEATLAAEQEASAVDAARTKLASHRASVAALREQLAISEAAMRTAEDEVLRAVVVARYPEASMLTTWNGDFEPVTAYDVTGRKIGPRSQDEHYELLQELRGALEDEDLPEQDAPSFLRWHSKITHDIDGVTPGMGPWVLISSAKDLAPVISDHVEFPFPANERHEWREATTAEIERYETYWNAQED